MRRSGDRPWTNVITENLSYREILCKEGCSPAARLILSSVENGRTVLPESRLPTWLLGYAAMGASNRHSSWDEGCGTSLCAPEGSWPTRICAQTGRSLQERKSIRFTPCIPILRCSTELKTYALCQYCVTPTKTFLRRKFSRKSEAPMRRLRYPG